MDEKQFMLDLMDMLRGNTQYITREVFVAKYGQYFVDLIKEGQCIRLADDHNEWKLSLQKVWSDETQTKKASV